MQLRNLPNVNAILAAPALAEFAAGPQRELVVELVREELGRARQKIRGGAEAPQAENLAEAVGERLAALGRSEPRRVVNATGVILHTNLGRAPLSDSADPGHAGSLQRIQQPGVGPGEWTARVQAVSLAGTAKEVDRGRGGAGG